LGVKKKEIMKPIVYEAQKPLDASYKKEPELAMGSITP